MSSGHGAADINVGALAAMLPFLIAATGMGYAQAAGLTFAAAVASTVSQPIFGIAADKFSKTWIMALGVLVSGCGIALVGLLSNQYWLMFAAALASGLGVGAFHPEGARMANRLSGAKKSSAMSLFSMGGTVGVASGPLIAAPAMLYLGLSGSLVLALPGIIVCIWLFSLIPGMRGFVQAKEREELNTAGTGALQKNQWIKFLWLCVAISSRSIISHSLNTFLPLYWVNDLHQSKALSGLVVSFMVFIGAMVSLLGGYLADRFGMIKVVKAGWLLLIPSVFFLTDIKHPALSLLMLVPIAIGSFAIIAPLIVLGQKCLPKSLGFASGIILGLGGSVGGMVTPILGGFADIHGLSAAFRLLAFLPVLGAVVAFTIKPPAK